MKVLFHLSKRTVGGVFRELDPARIDDVIESGPSGTGVVFLRRAEQVPTAGDALVHSGLAMLVVLVREGPVDVCEAANEVLMYCYVIAKTGDGEVPAGAALVKWIEIETLTSPCPFLA